VFFIVLFLFSINIYTLELWQGFNDDMSKEEVIKKAKKIFGNDLDITNNNRSGSSLNFSPELQKAISWNLPMSERLTIGFKNSVDIKEFQELLIVSFYFYNDKLMYISVKWFNTTDELLSTLSGQYGNPKYFQYTHIIGILSVTQTVYKWENSGREIFLDQGCIKYFNSNFNMEYNNRTKR
jgi:hypothetical protein